MSTIILSYCVPFTWCVGVWQPKSGRDVALPDLSPKALDYLKEIDELSDAFAKLANSESAVGTNGEAAIELGTNAP